MSYIKIFFGIFIALAASRLIPHPPNFTSLLALSFYIPAILGMRFIPALILSLVITDLIIGFHNTIFFTWGSIIMIGLISKYFKKNILSRLFGSLLGAVIFFIITNFGVWISGFYGHNMQGLIACYIMAIPFFSSSILATFIFSGTIEIIYNLKFIKKFSNNIR